MLPRIAIVGRPNVGKSSLLNMLAGRRISIVDAVAGVTRDRIGALVTIPSDDPDNPEHYAELIDTGGYGIEDAQNLTEQVEAQIREAVRTADLVLFVVDAQAGVTPLDERVAQVLRSRGKGAAPVLLVANKVDDASHEPAAYEAMSLGFGEPAMLSATTRNNQYELFERVRGALDFSRFEGATGESEPARGIELAIVGKRNAGKSTLVNTLAGGARVIVSEQAGTTRDSVDVRFEHDGQVFTAIDTAGARKRKSFEGDIDYYSHHRALRSIRRADVVLLMIDAAVPVSQVDRKLTNEILEHHKPAIIVVNKWDLAESEHTEEEYAEYLDKALQGLRFAPIAFISAEQREGIDELLDTVRHLHEQAGERVATAQLNEVIEALSAERGPRSKGGKPGRIFYGTQLETHPPTIALFVNDPELFDPGYERFILNRFRDHLPFSEVPIKLVFRSHHHGQEPRGGGKRSRSRR
ncbi:MAG: ribosome biogenesis GTPase Der [Phycisphaeraceae bacterium]